MYPLNTTLIPTPLPHLTGDSENQYERKATGPEMEEKKIRKKGITAHTKDFHVFQQSKIILLF